MSNIPKLALSTACSIKEIDVGLKALHTILRARYGFLIENTSNKNNPSNSANIKSINLKESGDHL